MSKKNKNQEPTDVERRMKRLEDLLNLGRDEGAKNIHFLLSATRNKHSECNNLRFQLASVFEFVQSKGLEKEYEEWTKEQEKLAEAQAKAQREALQIPKQETTAPEEIKVVPSDPADVKEVGAIPQETPKDESTGTPGQAPTDGTVGEPNKA